MISGLIITTVIKINTIVYPVITTIQEIQFIQADNVNITDNQIPVQLIKKVYLSEV